MMSLTFGLFTQVSGLGPLGPLVLKNVDNYLKIISYLFLSGALYYHQF